MRFRLLMKGRQTQTDRQTDRLKVHTYTKFEANISWGSKVMSIFTNQRTNGPVKRSSHLGQAQN